MSLRTFFISLLICLFTFMNGDRIAVAAENEGLEYKLKAAFLLNFAKFTTWPESSFAEEQVVNFCVAGEDPFGEALKGIESKKVAGNQVRLHHVETISAARACHVVFVSRSEQDKLVDLQQFPPGSAIVTVSDIEGFSHQGGMFEFITKDGHLAFIINNQQVTRMGLKVNASLLNLAAEVL